MKGIAGVDRLTNDIDFLYRNGSGKEDKPQLQETANRLNCSIADVIAKFGYDRSRYEIIYSEPRGIFVHDKREMVGYFCKEATLTDNEAFIVNGFLLRKAYKMLRDFLMDMIYQWKHY